VHRSGYFVLITVVLGLLSGAADSVCQPVQIWMSTRRGFQNPFPGSEAADDDR
jgi:hypothetical protein